MPISSGSANCGRQQPVKLSEFDSVTGTISDVICDRSLKSDGRGSEVLANAGRMTPLR